MPHEKKHSQNRKSILFLLTQDLESPSGLGRYYPLGKYLVKSGYAVRIAALHSNYRALEKKNMDMEGVKVSYVAQMHVKKLGDQTEHFPPIRLLWCSVVATWRLLMTALTHPTDMIVIGKPHPMNSIAGLIAGKLRRKKIILDCDDYEAVSNYFSSSWQKVIIQYFEDTMPKFVHKVATNTIFNKDRMISIGVKEEKIIYLPNGVDLDRYLIIDERKTKELIQQLELWNKRVIAYVGSLSLMNHPVDLLIRAFKEIHQDQPNVKLLIVGGGKDFKKLESLVMRCGLKEDVIFTGRVTPNMVPYYYDIADVTVDPVYDNDVAKGRCPLKMFESWAMKTPFVTADVGDRKYIAGSPPAALFFESGNPIDLASKIVQLLNTEELKDQLCILGFELVQKYQWSVIAAEFNKWMKL